MNDELTGSITRMIRRLNGSDQQALYDLYHRCWPRLVELASRRFNFPSCRIADEEDVAAEAFWSFWHAYRNQRTPQLENRHHLFALLTHLVMCRAADHCQREFGTAKRGGKTVITETDLAGGNSQHGFWQLADRGQPPEWQVELDDLYESFVERLPSSLRQVARMHVAGCSRADMAKALDCAERTIARKLESIREFWNQQFLHLVRSE